jgi:hypothetical protein
LAWTNRILVGFDIFTKRNRIFNMKFLDAGNILLLTASEGCCRQIYDVLKDGAPYMWARQMIKVHARTSKDNVRRHFDFSKNTTSFRTFPSTSLVSNVNPSGRRRSYRYLFTELQRFEHFVWTKFTSLSG